MPTYVQQPVNISWHHLGRLTVQRLLESSTKEGSCSLLPSTRLWKTDIDWCFTMLLQSFRRKEAAFWCVPLTILPRKCEHPQVHTGINRSRKNGEKWYLEANLFQDLWLMVPPGRALPSRCSYWANRQPGGRHRHTPSHRRWSWQCGCTVMTRTAYMCACWRNIGKGLWIYEQTAIDREAIVVVVCNNLDCFHRLMVVAETNIWKTAKLSIISRKGVE